MARSLQSRSQVKELIVIKVATKILCSAIMSKQKTSIKTWCVCVCVCVCVLVFTCQQSADWQVYGYFVLRHLIPERLHTVTSQTQADWLLTVCKATVTVTERAQTLPVGFDQNTLLQHTEIFQSQ